MKFFIPILFLTIIVSSCQEEDWTINSKGLIKLDQVGLQKDGWGVSDIVVSHDGKRVYYAAVNFQTSRFELRTIDEFSVAKKLFSGDGFIDAIDISEDDNTILYSISRNFGSESWLYEYPLNSRIQAKLLTVVGDGYFWEAKYLTENTILYSQGHGGVGLSLRKIDRNTKEVTVILDKADNPQVKDIDKANEKILVMGWTNQSLRVLDFDGVVIKDLGNQSTFINAICLSHDGTEILGSDFEPNSFKIVAFNIQSGEKGIMHSATASVWPLAYVNDKNNLLCMKQGQLSLELFLYERNQNKFNQLTNNNLNESFLGFYGNSTDRLLLSAIDDTGQTALYILNR